MTPPTPTPEEIASGPPMTLSEEDMLVLYTIAKAKRPVVPREISRLCMATNGRMTKLHRYGLLAREPVPSWLGSPKRRNYFYSATDKARALLRGDRP